ncbi:histidinol dehydrogenase [bacterium]|nr:histidinol dehydrogenase [bacterium]
MINNKVTYLNSKEDNFDQKLNEFLRSRNILDVDIEKIVFDITSQIKTHGDNALITMINKFDNISCSNLDDIRIENKLLKKAFDDLPIDLKNAMKIASSRIKSFHEKQKPGGFDYKDELGVNLGLKYSPIKRVGFYTPGGKALYPSSVLMNAVPALVAGVEERVLVSPINFEKSSEILLAAAYLAEVTEFYRMGGAHAIAALAFGTQDLKKVDKIVGPGNAYVAEAKRQLFGKVGIDSVAGPSEVLIVADNKNNPEWIAIDLLSQAEHDENAQSILITNDEKFAKDVENQIVKLLETLPRKKIASSSWYNNGLILIIDHINECIDIINQIAPEHLELCIENPRLYLDDINNAGSIFLGSYTPEAIGDYIAGPNHVLPTEGTARFSSGLGTNDFLRRTTFVQCNEYNLNKLGKHAEILAEAEGLDAHKMSIYARRKDD